MAYQWRNRTGEFHQKVQPAWMRGLRRAWLKNPTGQVSAYREVQTQHLVAPEAAGPTALPVLVSTPLKVTKEYAREIRAAWPEAEVLFIEKHTDILSWMKQCATSAAPAVIAIVSHSLTRAFGREWQPCVRERTYPSVVPDLDPDEALLATLEPVYDHRDRLVGFRSKETGELHTKQVTVSHFYCPSCSVSRQFPPLGHIGRIDAMPGQRDPAGQEQGAQEGQVSLSGQESLENARQSEPVTSLTWFRQKPRWCTCCTDWRNVERRSMGKPVLRSPLWQERRTAATERKNPQLSFAAWSQAMASLGEITRQEEARATVASLVNVSGTMKRFWSPCWRGYCGTEHGSPTS
jgi:hypothetical protein